MPEDDIQSGSQTFTVDVADASSSSSSSISELIPPPPPPTSSSSSASSSAPAATLGISLAAPAVEGAKTCFDFTVNGTSTAMSASLSVTQPGGSFSTTGSVALANGSGQACFDQGFPAGSFYVIASPNTEDLQSNVLMFSVDPAPSSSSAASSGTPPPLQNLNSFSASADPSDVYAGSETTVNAVLSFGEVAPGGSVSFYEGDMLLGTIDSAQFTLMNGNQVAAPLSYSSQLSGLHTIKAIYSGDANYLNAEATTAVNVVPLPNNGGGGDSSGGQGNSIILSVTEDSTQNIGESACFTVTASDYGVSNQLIARVYSGHTQIASANVDWIDIFGTVCFENLPAGSYTLMLDSDAQSGAYQATPLDFTVVDTSSASQTLITPTISVSPLLASTTQASLTTITVADPTQSAVPSGTVNVTNADKSVTYFTGTLDANGQIAQQISFAAAGNYTLHIFYDGDASFAPTSSDVTIEVTAPASSAPPSSSAPQLLGTAFQFSPGSTPINQQVQLSATVIPSEGTAIPTGTVTFSENKTLLGSANLTDGTGNVFHTFTTSGVHTIHIEYSGDGTYGSKSEDVQVEVTDVSIPPISSSASSSSAQSSPPATLISGRAEEAFTNWQSTLRAHVTDLQGEAMATGKVEFYDGAILIGYGNLYEGDALKSWVFDSTGPHTITIKYLGDGTYAPNSTTFVVDVGDGSGGVNKPQPAITMSPAVTPVAPTTTFTITVSDPSGSGPVPTGTVRLSSGFGTYTLVNGAATLSIGTGQAIPNGITLYLQYSGDDNWAGKTAAQLVKIVPASSSSSASSSSEPPPSSSSSSAPPPSPVQPTISVTPATAVVGEATDVTVTVADPTHAGTPGGTVVVSNGAGDVSYFRGSLGSDGTVTQPVTFAAAGSYMLKVVYLGGSSYTPAISYVTIEAKAASSSSSSSAPSLRGTTVEGGPPSATVDSPITLNASVIDPDLLGRPSGNVEFYEGKDLLGIALIEDGEASLSHTFTTTGPHTIVANYLGDGLYAPNGTTFDVNVSAADSSSSEVSSSSSSAALLRVSYDVQLSAYEWTEGDDTAATIRLSGSSGPPTGKLTIEGRSRNMRVVIGPLDLVDGAVTTSLKDVPAGIKVLILRYSGDGIYSADSASQTIVVNDATASSSSASSAESSSSSSEPSSSEVSSSSSSDEPSSSSASQPGGGGGQAPSSSASSSVLVPPSIQSQTLTMSITSPLSSVVHNSVTSYFKQKGINPDGVTFAPSSLGYATVTPDRAEISTSLSAINAAAGNEKQSPFDLWLDATFGVLGQGKTSGTSGRANLGLSYLFAPTMLAGTVVTLDRTDTKNGAATASNTSATLTPFIGGKVGDNLFYDAYAGLGLDWLSVSPDGTYTDAVSGRRWMLGATVSGQYRAGNWMFAPVLSASYDQIDLGSYTSGSGGTVAADSTGHGEISLTPRLAVDLDLGNGVVITPNAQLAAALGLEYHNGNWTYSGLTDSVGAGLDVATPGGATFSTSVTARGLAFGDVTSLSGRAGLHAPLK